MKNQSLPLFKYIGNNQCQNMIRNAVKPQEERPKSLKIISGIYQITM